MRPEKKNLYGFKMFKKLFFLWKFVVSKQKSHYLWRKTALSNEFSIIRIMMQPDFADFKLQIDQKD